MEIKRKNGNFGEFSSIMKRVYEQVDSIPRHDLMAVDVTWDGYPDILQNYIETVYTIPNHRQFIYTNPTTVETGRKLSQNPDDKRVLVAFSGGKDSTAAVIKLLDKGYTPILFHVRKINRSYYNEVNWAKNIADKLGLEFIICDDLTFSKQVYPESPVKNQFMLSLMLDIGVERGIHNYSMGTMWRDLVDNSSWEYNGSDSQEVVQAFNSFLKQVFMDYEYLNMIEDNFDSIYTIVNSKYSFLIEDIQSCITPDRFRSSRIKTNRKKYGVEPLGNRCGSCHKCELDYIILTGLGYYKPTSIEFMKHQFDVLREKAVPTLGEGHEISKDATPEEILREWDVPVDRLLEINQSLKWFNVSV